jgi:hypothetical protein
MKELLWMGFCAGLALPVCAQVAAPASAPAVATDATKPAVAAAVVNPAPAGTLDWDGGADLRIRQELSDNLPLAGGSTAKNASYLRIRPRVWGQVKNEDFKFYIRAAEEFREYFQPSESRNYQTPDEVLIDSLYLDLYNLFDGKLDLRIGRQDFFGATGPTYGAGRVLCDGTPADGSRTVFMDAIKATVKFDDKNALDVLAIYNNPDTELSWGHAYKADGSEWDERQLTSINGRSTDLTEWGGGLYFKSKEFARVPFELYYLYKRESKARMSSGTKLQGRIVNTWGTRLTPQLTETLSAELEGAVQAGEKDGGASTSGYMGYAGLTYKPLVDSTSKPYFTGSCYYLSGDNDRGTGDNDSAWDPLWSRWPQFSEMYVYGTTYGVGYWSNMIYPSLETGVGFSPGHKVKASVGPMYAASDDNLGGGGGDFYGWLGVVRYDFPLFKNIFGKRGDLSGHVTAEVLDPGDYYSSDTVSYFLRWEVVAKF